MIAGHIYNPLSSPRSYIKPQEVPQATGGTVVIGLRREIPERFWSFLEILLVGGTGGQISLKPSGIKRGKKICIRVPSGMECRDYDVRVVRRFVERRVVPFFLPRDRVSCVESSKGRA